MKILRHLNDDISCFIVSTLCFAFLLRLLLGSISNSVYLGQNNLVLIQKLKNGIVIQKTNIKHSTAKERNTQKNTHTKTSKVIFA